MVDTLEYLHKGGRMKRSMATIGTILHIKPIITIDTAGFVNLKGKAVGTKLAFKHLLKIVSQDDIDLDYEPKFLYTQNKTKCEKLINVIFPNSECAFADNALNVCPVVGAHIGPNGAGLTYVVKK